MENNLKITTIKDLKGYAEGSLIQLPAFGVNQPFCAKVRRPSLLKMVKNGEIPNTLVSTAAKLFAGDNSAFDDIAKDDGKGLKQILNLCEVMAEACLVSPSYSELQNAGIDLTDEQLIFLFNYSQRGIEALRPFRKK